MLAELLDTRDPADLASEFRRCFRIGEVLLAINGRSVEDVRCTPGSQEFLAENATADVEVRIQWAENLRAWPGQMSFDSGAVWTLFRDGADVIFDFRSSVVSPHPYKRLRVHEGFRHAELTMNREALRHFPECSPLEYPTDELLLTNYLACHGLGVEVHGCGLIDSDAGGHLFLGHSGAGKSTTARLWESFHTPEILSDDRIILRLHDGQLWMYGTPWHGEAEFASATKARLKRIFILQQGRENKIVALPKALAVGELFARCFPPFHSAAGLERTVDFLSRALRAVPCCQFQFVPDASAVDTVLGFHE